MSKDLPYHKEAVGVLGAQVNISFEYSRKKKLNLILIYAEFIFGSCTRRIKRANKTPY